MSFISSIKTLLTFGRGVVGGLPDGTEDKDPINLFRGWFEAAKKSGILLPEAMSLATSTPDGFYTNYGSQKASEIDRNPYAAICFHWPILQRQVRISGKVERVPDDESRDYFVTRSRASQLGAWASKQSENLSDRAELETRVRTYSEKFSGDNVPLPPFWGGYRLKAEQIEFWQGRVDRLHDRVLFKRSSDGWKSERLYP